MQRPERNILPIAIAVAQGVRFTSIVVEHGD